MGILTLYHRFRKFALMTDDYSLSPLVNFVVTATDTVCGEACVVTAVDDAVLTLP